MEKLSSSQKNRIAQALFYIAFIMEILIRSLNSAGVDILYRSRLMQLAAILFGVKIILTHYSKREWCVIVATAVLTMIPFFTMRETLWIEIAMMIIASKDVDREKSFRCYFGLLSVSMILMAVLSATGLIDNFVLIKDFDRGGVETRYCFGFSHPNVFYSNLLLLVAMGMYVFCKRMKTWHYIMLTGLNVLLMTLSLSRNGFIVVQLLIIAMFVVQKWPQVIENRVVYGLGYVAIGLAALLSYAIFFVDWKLLEGLNNILTGRLVLAVYAAPIAEWRLLPVIREGIVLDMGFVNVMYYWGILFGLLYILLIFLNYRQFKIKKDYAALVILLSYTLFTMIEAHAFSMYFVGNLMFILMIGWGKEQYYVSAEKSDS